MIGIINDKQINSKVVEKNEIKLQLFYIKCELSILLLQPWNLACITQFV